MTGTEIEYDGDPALWLRPGESILTPERARMPDIVIEVPCTDCNGTGLVAARRCAACSGRKRVRDDTGMSVVQFAQAQVLNVMNYLHALEELDDQQVHDGRIYEIWREVFCATFGYKKNSIYSTLKGELESEGLCNEYGFVLLLQKLSIADQQAIDLAIYTPSTEHGRFIGDRSAKRIRQALNSLTRILPEIRDALEALKGKSRVATDADWALVKERLQNPSK